MAINLTDALNAATTKGKLADAKQIYLEGDNKNLQDAHKDNEDHLNTLDTRSTQIEESLKTIAATGGASNANAVIYDNNVSGLTAVNVKGALDELAMRLKDEFSYKGIATPTTNPGTPDGNVFYLAGEGSYPNFSGLSVNMGELAVFKWNGSWSKQTVKVGLQPNELNISYLFPTSGEGGTNKYTLAGAIAQVPSEYRTIKGLNITFVSNETSEPETWEYKGGSWAVDSFSEVGANKFSKVDKVNNYLLNSKLPISYDKNRYISGSEQKGRYINSEGKIVGGHPNYAVSSFVVINKGETLIFSQFDTAMSLQGYAALFDIYGKAIKSSIVQSDTLTWVEGAVYAAWTTASRHINDTGSKGLYCYEQSNPITAWEEPKIIIPYSMVEDYIKVKVDRKEFNDIVYGISEIELAYTLFSGSKYITSSGSLNHTGGCNVFKIIPDNILYLHFSVLRFANNISGIFVGWYKGEGEYVSTILEAKSSELLKDVYIDLQNKPEDAEYILFTHNTHTYGENPIVYGIANLATTIDNNKQEQSVINKEVYLKLSEKPNLIIGKNKYKRGTGLDVRGAYINSKGKIVWGNGNGGVTAPIRIKEGETLKFSGFTSSLATQQNYAALYDKYDNPIPETIIQSDTLTWVEGAVYARWSTSANIVSETNAFYCYDVNNPLYEWEKYTEHIDESLIPDKDTASYRFIDVVGDSIGSQIGSAMSKMNTLNPLGNHIIRNKCVGGESCLDTLAHVGVIPYAIEPFTIPAGKNTIVDIKISPQNFLKTVIDEDGENKTYINTYYKGESGEKTSVYGEGISPFGSQKSFVNGVLGNLLFKRAVTNRDNYGFQRLEDGEEVAIDSVSYAKPATVTRDAILVCFMGTNGGWEPVDIKDKVGDSEYPNLTISRKECADILVDYYKKLATLCAPQYNDYVFLGFYMTAFVDQQNTAGRIAFWNYFDMRMEQEFGFRYLNVRKYLREYGWKDAGYKLGYRLVNDPEGGEGAKKYTCLPDDIKADKQAIQEGRIPWCIVNGPDGVHMLSRPSACVANQVFKRLYEIGAISEYRQIDISTIKDAENADINEPDYGN